MDDSEKRLAWKLVRYKDIMAGIANIPVIEDDNCLLFKNNISKSFIEVRAKTGLLGNQIKIQLLLSN